MPQTRGTFPALTDGMDKQVLLYLGQSLKELPKIYTKVFSIKKSSKKFERIVTGVGFGDIPEKTEGAAYATDVFAQGYTKDFTHVEFGAMFEATETAEEDDEYNVLKQKAKWLGYSSRYTIEKYAANVFNNGFGTAGAAGTENSADGISVFNTQHPLKSGGTASNRHATNDDLSPTSLLQAIADVQTENKLDSGQIAMPIQSWIIHVPPALETVAYRLVKSEGLPGVADNDKNAIRVRNWQVVVNPLITDSDSWFLVAADKGMHGFCSYQRVPISVKPPENDSRTGNRLYKVRFRQSWGVIQWQGSYGSSGS